MLLNLRHSRLRYEAILAAIFGIAVTFAVIDKANSSCLTQAGAIIRTPVLNERGQIMSAPAKTTYDFRRIFLAANPLKYPLVLHSPGTGVCITGGKIQGHQSVSMTWRQMKDQWDGDGIGFQGLTGTAVAENFWTDNVMDGFSPRGSYSAYWTVRGLYARHIRDDFIENDGCLAGLVDDALVDGAFMFLSMRPGSSGGACGASRTVTIRNSVVKLECQAYGDRDNGAPTLSCGGGTGVGQLFKVSSPTMTLAVSNTVLLVPSLSVNGATSMGFPPGSYSNVTLVWLGNGKYPRALPSGVKVTTDPSVWSAARQSWLARHGCDSQGNDCAFLHK